MEVKQSAAAQVWSGRTSSPPRFDIRARSGYWDGEASRWRASPGRQADAYVFAWHAGTGDSADQREPRSWRFHVVPERDLPDQKTIGLSVVRRLAQPCTTDDLPAELEAVIAPPAD